MSATRDSIVVLAALVVVVSTLPFAATGAVGPRDRVDGPPPAPDTGASNASIDRAAGDDPGGEPGAVVASSVDRLGIAAVDSDDDAGFTATGGTVRPGGNLTLAVTYTNDGTRTEEVSVQLGFEAPLDGDGWEIVDFGAPDGGEWFESDRYFRAAEVEPNETVTATVTVRPPPDASPGTYTIGATASATDGESGIEESLDVPVTIESACDGGPETVSRVAFAYGAYGGNLNLEVNGDFRNVDRFGALNGTTVGGATVTVNRTSPEQGTVTIAGEISGFCVGGQELWIDEVAFGPASNPRSVVGFDRLQPARSEYQVGDAFRALPSNVTVGVAGFRFSDGTRYVNGTAARSNRSPPLSGGSGQDINARNVNLAFEIGSVPERSERPFELNLAERPTEEGARRLAELVQEGELTEDDAAGRLEELRPEKAGEILEYLMFHGEPILAADLLDRMDERAASAALDAAPRVREIVTRPRFRQMRDGLPKGDLARLVREREEGRFFTPDGSNVTLLNVSEIPDIEIQRRNLPPLNRSRTLNARSTPQVSPRWYDAKVRWKEPGATGFGWYSNLDLSRDNGAILASAGRGKSGGWWRKESWNSTRSWDRVAHNLKARYDIVDMAIDPTDADHLYAIAPKTRETFSLLESTDGGMTWHEDREFARKFMLKDAKEGTSEFDRGASVEIFDNGNVFVYNYEGTGASRTPGNFSADFQGGEGLSRSIDLSSNSGVTITYYERAASFDGGKEKPKLQFYDGSQWHTLKTAGPNGFDWRKQTATVPNRWLDADNRIRFKFGNGEPGDHWFVDNVTVSSASGKVFEEDWEDRNLRDWSTIGRRVPQNH
ncbi:MAG: NEW3 domain-containing protein [Haloarculaceae archaeon]